MAELSVLIVNYNSWRECAQAIASLREHGPTRADGSPMPFECIVVDNDSPRQAPQLIELVERELQLLREQQGDERAGVLVRHDENGGYSKGMNLAFAHSRGRQILISNPDVIFLEGLLPRLQRALEGDPSIGIAVPKGFWDRDHHGHLPPNTLPTLGDAWGEALASYSAWWTRRRARRLLRSWLRVWQADEPIALPMMSGCMFLIERDYFESIGKWDERFPLYYEDADLSVTIRRSGRTITQVPDARLVHFVNRSGMSDLETMWSRNRVSKQLYYEKWYGLRGRLTMAACRWLASNKLLARFRRVAPQPPFTDLGESAERPVLELPRHCARFVVLMSLDMRFFLAAGIYGAGDRWTPSDAAFESFVNANFFFQVYDLSNGEPEHLGTWRYYCLSHLGTPVRPAVEGAAT
ncbi:MAG: glycosyltransferase family 2 protein [Planctomycetes bacterium]|nr:glycosyltransferase family 2 protein [Planctomycetota bacterium]